MIRTVHIRTSNLDEYLILIKLLRNVENITSIYYLWIFPCWIDQAYTVVDNTDNTIILQDNIGNWWICFVRNPCDSSGCCLDCLLFSWIDQKDFMLAGLYPLRKYQSTGGIPLKQGNQGSNVSNILKSEDHQIDLVKQHTLEKSSTVPTLGWIGLVLSFAMPRRPINFPSRAQNRFPFLGAQSFGSVLTHEHLAAKSRNFQGPFSPSPDKATCVLKLGGPVGSLIYN